MGFGASLEETLKMFPNFVWDYPNEKISTKQPIIYVETGNFDYETSAVAGRSQRGLDLGPILRISISAENISDQIFILKFGTNFRHKQQL
jgi:hypothetical protein